MSKNSRFIKKWLLPFTVKFSDQ